MGSFLYDNLGQVSLHALAVIAVAAATVVMVCALFGVGQVAA